ncbi:MAG: hypothetical protein NZ700_17205 [Gemmataceae bacterium]|nr:hypothetical protein [Gemmataceae bacterium]MDW8264854.1 hypothetical protein [Gemmataceae bacterium]
MRQAKDANIAVCTIVANNYLAYARTLMQSVAQWHPDWSRYVLLVDRPRPDYQPDAEPFRTLPLETLNLPEPKRFCFRYTLLELSTAVKPWLLEWLFDHTPCQQVVYLDPDIRLYRPLGEVTERLDAGQLMVLTPHLTGRLDDKHKPREKDILVAGSYNLGFIALGRHPELPHFLRWWQEKLEYDCRVAWDEGLFVDQRWVDLAPGMFSDVSILRHPGYNVAYWNLAHRRVERTPRGYEVNGQPLTFFHFSGLDPLAPQLVSKHQDRFQLSDLGAAADLVLDYCRAVLANGYETCRSWPCAYGFFDDGTPIPDCVRLAYRRDEATRARPGDDPFAEKPLWLNEPPGPALEPLVSRLMMAVWRRWEHLQNLFPDPLGLSRRPFADWYVCRGAWEEHIPDEFVSPVLQSLRRLRHYAPGAFVREHRALRESELLSPLQARALRLVRRAVWWSRRLRLHRLLPGDPWRTWLKRGIKPFVPKKLRSWVREEMRLYGDARPPAAA